MKQFARDLFSENAKVSMVRLLSLICVLTASGIAIYGIYIGRDLMGLSALCTVFLTTAFGGKVIQKNFERKEDQ